MLVLVEPANWLEYMYTCTLVHTGWEPGTIVGVSPMGLILEQHESLVYFEFSTFTCSQKVPNHGSKMN